LNLKREQETVMIRHALSFVVFSTALCLRVGGTCAADYQFDRTISREVLENYLARSITMEGLLTGRGDLDDDVRMLKHIGAKFAGRSRCLWGNEANFLSNLERARQAVPKIRPPLSSPPAAQARRRAYSIDTATLTIKSPRFRSFMAFGRARSTFPAFRCSACSTRPWGSRPSFRTWMPAARRKLIPSG
jgi:hypothetical protein